MLDSQGRNIDYLRVSVTDRCNMRCIYCMPSHGVEWKPHDTILSFEDTLKICNILANMGIRKVKVTGGEPLVRRGCTDFIKNLKNITGIEEVTLTTNGLLLNDYLHEIADTLDGINISLDSLDRTRYHAISGSDGLDIVLSAIERVLKAGIKVKINVVPILGLNEEDIIPLAGLAKNKNIHVRFIELMPLGLAGTYKPVLGKEIAAKIESFHGKLIPFDTAGESRAGESRSLGNGPAKYYSIEGFKGKIGFINAMTDCFCVNCNRIRLTSVGILKPCLGSEQGTDLKPFLKTGSDLEKVLFKTIFNKQIKHSFTGLEEGMFRVGG